MTAADVTARVLTGLTVTGLAGVAGAISFSHMAQLAFEHGQAGWRALAFPVSVDGLEVVASLYLVVCHRTRRNSGWLPWLMLIAGTAASLAANVAVGGHDLIGRVLAGWPALSMLVSVKLLFSMFEPAGPSGTVPDGPGTDETMDIVRGTVRPSVRDVRWAGRTVLARSGTVLQPSAAVRDRGTELAVLAGRPELLPAARAAHATIAARGRQPSRDALAAQMRADGHPVSNARACTLLRLLRTEHTTTATSTSSTLTAVAPERPRALRRPTAAGVASDGYLPGYHGSDQGGGERWLASSNDVCNDERNDHENAGERYPLNTTFPHVNPVEQTRSSGPD